MSMTDTHFNFDEPSNVTKSEDVCYKNPILSSSTSLLSSFKVECYIPTEQDGRVLSQTHMGFRLGLFVMNDFLAVFLYYESEIPIRIDARAITLKSNKLHPCSQDNVTNNCPMCKTKVMEFVVLSASLVLLVLVYSFSDMCKRSEHSPLGTLVPSPVDWVEVTPPSSH
jgi:hypothetical protein